MRLEDPRSANQTRVHPATWHTRRPMEVHDLPTPALVIEVGALDANLATMAAAHPGAALRPHVKAHKCTALAARQQAAGHRAFTCATPREAVGMAAAGLGGDLSIANEVVDPRRLEALHAIGDGAWVTVAVDSAGTIAAAALAGIRAVVDRRRRRPPPLRLRPRPTPGAWPTSPARRVSRCAA